MKVLSVFVLLCVSVAVLGDLYLHNPRGSNDRLNEANTDRNNANRLFNSQNNAKGGYCYGPAMSFYERSLLTIEWTAQHGCGNAKLYCNMVIQYMCSASDAPPEIKVRDGKTTGTIPDSMAGVTQVDAASGELQFGMHESYASYQACKIRQRNMGLWIADREEEGGLTPGRASSIFTRQNNDGNRHGFECQEERDYYPYWAPSDWKDIAVLTEDTSYCKVYKSESQNKASKGYCVDKADQSKVIFPNNPGDCQVAKGVWLEKDSWGIDAPDCIEAPWSRDNHLGNGRGGYANTYNWTLPTSKDEPCIGDNNCNCVLRLRYNISTTDLNFLKDDTISGNDVSSGFIDWNNNAGASPIYDDMIVPGSGMDHQLAMDTTQFGRTFQDRSHVFHILSRDGSGASKNAKIYNLNVRGKRGNIVQAYPATEYDFVPEILHVKKDDYIHFQWTGCDTNPAGNAGEGTDQTDRSNIVQIIDLGANVPAPDDWLDSHKPYILFPDDDLRKRMAFLDQDPSVCLTYEQLLAQNNNNDNAAKADVRNCMKLNAASQYFNGGLVKMSQTSPEPGFFYMSSRNNNFSNRGQKATIIVSNYLPNWAIGVTVAGAALFLGAAGVAGATFYAKTHPHSNIANIFSKL